VQIGRIEQSNPAQSRHVEDLEPPALRADEPPRAHGVTKPTDLDDRRKGMLQNLRAAGDADFDLAYLHQQLAAHLEALTLHGGYADHGDNAALKAVAAQVKPLVEHHISEIKRIGGDKLKDAT
jgi:predicted outer membrane protein